MYYLKAYGCGWGLWRFLECFVFCFSFPHVSSVPCLSLYSCVVCVLKWRGSSSWLSWASGNWFFTPPSLHTCLSSAHQPAALLPWFSNHSPPDCCFNTVDHHPLFSLPATLPHPPHFNQPNLPAFSPHLTINTFTAPNLLCPALGSPFKLPLIYGSFVELCLISPWQILPTWWCTSLSSVLIKYLPTSH